MAYDNTAINLVTESPLQGAGQTWRYQPAAPDAQATVAAADYISDGVARRIVVGDQVIAMTSDNGLVSYEVTALNANGLGVNLSAGVKIN